MELASQNKRKLGTLTGVFIPNFLQMMGVVFFMRMGWVMGHVGLSTMALIIAMSCSILIMTSFSLSSIVSNMKVEGGGAYFMISRLLGIEFGTSIGLLLVASQVSVIALCSGGFSLLFIEFFPVFPLYAVQIGSLLILGSISAISTRLAVRSQLLIFVCLMGALLSIFLGRSEGAQEITSTALTTLPFWAAFAFFFPATTGIETGLSFSGDLKNPGRSLTLGTLASVLASFLMYLLMAFFLSHHASPTQLRARPFIVHDLSLYGPLVIAGVFGSLLSAALSGLMAAPRILQALAKDQVVMGSLNKRYIGTGIVLGGSLLLTLAFDINHLIPLLTMVFLVLYGLINFVAFFQAFLRNPSWRPEFAIPWPMPLFCSSACLFLMFMVNAGAAFLVLLMITILGWWIAKRKMTGNWDDIRHSLFSFLVHKGAAKLSQLRQNPKSWRPNLLVLTGHEDLNKNLAYFAHCLDHGKGFLTFSSSCASHPTEREANLKKTLDSLNIPSFTHVNLAKDPTVGSLQAIHNYGFGPLIPNTLVMPFNPAQAALVKDAESAGKNLILLKDDPSNWRLFTEKTATPKQINLWWRGENQQNFELSLALSYSLRGSGAWANAQICIKSIVADKAKEKKLIHVFERYREKMRLSDVLFESIIDPEEKFFSDLMLYSNDADFTFLGFRGFQQGESVEDYTRYLSHLDEKTKELKNVAFVLARQDLDFLKIFS